MSKSKKKPIVIGIGSYGCVHKPSLLCKTKKMNYKNKISKYMLTQYANLELKEYKTIENADKKEYLYLGKPDKCTPDMNSENNDAIAKCYGLNTDDPTNYSLLVMGDGGENLEQFAKRFSKKQTTAENKKIMELFWIEMQRMLYGLTVFMNNDIVHHDLKAGNIVYNEETNRANFIDFGLMTSKQKIIDECKKTRYNMAIPHWSFPFELHIMNKKHFDKIAKWNRNQKEAYVNEFVEKNIKKGDANSFKSFFSVLFGNLSKSNQNENIKIVVNDYKDFILDDFTNYEYILNKSINTIDIYGTGIALSVVLTNTSKFIDDSLANELSDCFLSMVTNHLPSRLEPVEALHMYEQIIQKHGLLDKHKKHYDNHIIKDSIETESVLEKKIDKMNIDLTMSPEDIIKINLPPTKICPPSKEPHPIHGRCVNKCKPGKIRNANARCVKNKTVKNNASTISATV